MITAWMGLLGCAVGYHHGVVSHDMGTELAEGESSILVDQYPYRHSGRYHQIRLVDTSGFLMGAITTSANQHAAREEALENSMDYDGDGYIEYDYEVGAFTPGYRVTSDLRLGTPGSELAFQGDGSLQPQAFEMPERVYLGWDVIAELQPRSLGPVLWTPTLAFRMEKLSAQTTLTDADILGLDVYAGLQANLVLRDQLILRGSGDLGVVTPLMKLLMGPTAPTLARNAGLELVWRPSRAVGVSATADWGTMAALERRVQYQRYGVGLIVGAAGVAPAHEDSGAQAGLTR
ncbi:MAG: hypothetical protein VX899_26290 [Myxococcota bacterium]|nr:hypothetical protein [Myxococcota bacterium]